MFKLRNYYNLCTSSFQILCLLQVSKYLGWGHVYHGVAVFLKQFEDVWASRLWVSGVLVLEFGRILAWYRFPAAEEFVVIFDIFLFNDATDVLYRWNIWTAGRQIQHPDSILRSHAVVLAAVCGFALSCWITQGLPWNRCRVEGSICCSKTFIYLSPFIVPSKTCKLPIPYALMLPHPIRDAGFFTVRWWHTGRSPSSLARRTRRPWFPTRMSNLDLSAHRTLFQLSILNEPWPTGHHNIYAPCLHITSFLHDRT